jgi:hypothetical protein
MKLWQTGQVQIMAGCGSSEGFLSTYILYSTIYHLTEHLVSDNVIVKYKGGLVFSQYNTKKKGFGIKLYKFCGSKGYIYL